MSSITDVRIQESATGWLLLACGVAEEGRKSAKAKPQGMMIDGAIGSRQD